MILIDNRKEIIKELENIKNILSLNLKIEVFDIDDIIEKIEKGKKKEAKKELNELIKNLLKFLKLRKEILDTYEKSLNILEKIHYITSKNALIRDIRNPKAIDVDKTYSRIRDTILNIKKLIKELEKDIKKIKEESQKIKELNIKDNDDLFKYAISFILKFDTNRMENIINEIYDELTNILVRSNNLEESYYNKSGEVIKKILSEFGIYFEFIEELEKFRNEIIRRKYEYERIINEDIKILEQISKKL